MNQSGQDLGRAPSSRYAFGHLSGPSFGSSYFRLPCLNKWVRVGAGRSPIGKSQIFAADETSNQSEYSFTAEPIAKTSLCIIILSRPTAPEILLESATMMKSQRPACVRANKVPQKGACSATEAFTSGLDLAITKTHGSLRAGTSIPCGGPRLGPDPRPNSPSKGLDARYNNGSL